MAFQVKDVVKGMEADSGICLTSVKVDGGASANNILMQMQADISCAPVKRPKCVETTAMGAAYLAGLAVGYWKSKDDVIKNWAIDQRYIPMIDEVTRKKKIAGWKRAVEHSFHWEQDEV